MRNLDNSLLRRSAPCARPDVTIAAMGRSYNSGSRIPEPPFHPTFSPAITVGEEGALKE
jgi:hypothetical protein